jgi:hypothetical protein
MLNDLDSLVCGVVQGQQRSVHVGPFLHPQFEGLTLAPRNPRSVLTGVVVKGGDRAGKQSTRGGAVWLIPAFSRQNESKRPSFLWLGEM